MLYNNVIWDSATGGDGAALEYLCLVCYLCALPLLTGDF